jgi:hypothetical protein
MAMFRKKLREMLNLMGVTDVDDEILDNLQRQLFQFLEFDDSLAGGITFKTGSILTTVQVQNYQEVKDRIHEGYKNGVAAEKMNLRLTISSFCLYLTEERNCQVTADKCQFEFGTRWWECEIVQASCQDTGDEEWK